MEIPNEFFKRFENRESEADFAVRKLLSSHTSESMVKRIWFEIRFGKLPSKN